MYRQLCEATQGEAGAVKLGRGPQGWGLQVVLRPTSEDPAWRAAGSIFPDLAELDAEAERLLSWLRVYRRDTATEEAR